MTSLEKSKIEQTYTLEIEMIPQSTTRPNNYASYHFKLEYWKNVR